MNRDEFEKDYARRHMGAEPSEASSVISLRELRNGDGYDDPLADLSWRNQLAINCIIIYFDVRQPEVQKLLSLLRW